MRTIFTVILLTCLAACTGPGQGGHTSAGQGQITGNDTTGPADTSAVRRSWKATGRIEGMAGNTRLVFEHMDYTAYRLRENGAVREGSLNTERGYGNDPDATVFILDDDKPLNAQRCFVRLSSGEIIMLDPARREVPGTKLKALAP